MKIQNKMFSIIVPVYNVEKYISTCLSSILLQTYDNYEIIIIDDGSTDDSPSIIDSYALQNPEKIASLHKKNGGLSSARNEGIKMSTGRYIIFLDSDDWFESKNILINLHEYIVNNTYPNVIVNLLETYIEGSEITECKYLFDVKYSGKNSMDILSYLLSIKGIFMGTPAFVIDRKYLIDKKLFFTDNLFYEDNLWLAQLFMRCEKIYLNNLHIFCYRLQRPGSITSSYSIKKLMDIYTIIELICNENRERKNYCLEIEEWCRIMLNQALVIASNIKIDDDMMKKISDNMHLLKNGNFKNKIIYFAYCIFGMKGILSVIKNVDRRF